MNKDNENNRLEVNAESVADDHVSRVGTLDDEQRIKVLSPSMLVIKRFFRNRLAMVGLCILIFMFLFAFAGGWVMPYAEDQVFYTDELFSKEYASVAYNSEFRYTVAEGEEFGSVAKSKFILAANTGKTVFSYDGVDYGIVKESESCYMIIKLASETPYSYDQAPANITAIVEAGDNSFEQGGVTNYIVDNGKGYAVMTGSDYSLVTTRIYSLYDQTQELSYNFKFAVEQAIKKGETAFSVDSVNYEIETVDEGSEKQQGVYTVYTVEGDSKTEFANISGFVVQPIADDIVISMEFREVIEQAVNDGAGTFVFPDASGVDEEYTVERKDNVYNIRKDVLTRLIDIYSYPSAEHLLGTDSHGMDVLTRLMYGGRVSLLIGFIVVLIELIIGVVLGGVAGYFSGWVDTLIMRLVDIFNCIPYMALIIIVGSVMDNLRIDPRDRIYLLMLIMGVLGWPSVARLVRGQILSLREQEFMTATEATGISVKRRIFSHLVPNVIPQLIVTATMGLGGIILTESTLSFLGLGVKYPYASWGNIINDVSNAYVMINYWFVWIPAGLLILLTVLGFNFVGDGLRDAFDPKMKR